jgi:hypothetical protein
MNKEFKRSASAFPPTAEASLERPNISGHSPRARERGMFAINKEQL